MSFTDHELLPDVHHIKATPHSTAAAVPRLKSVI